jgi:photosystem II stability/assembly factor-like uncharacterized protein
MIQNPVRAFKVLPLVVPLLFALPAISPAAQWRAIGPEGASIQALAVFPGEAGSVYAATLQGTIVESTAGAASWSSHGKLLEFSGELAADPARAGTLYAATFKGLFKSANGGVTWTGPVLAGNLWTFRISPSSPDVLYAARDQQVLKSTDGGASWTATSFAGPTSVLAVDPVDARVVYAEGFRSDDGGTTWVEARAGLENPNGGYQHIQALAIDPRQPATLYAAAGFGGIFKSVDRGATWSLVWTGPAGVFFDAEKLAIDPASGTVYVLDRFYGVFRSTGGGASWAPVLPVYGARDLAVDGRSPGRIYVGTEAGGVYRSDDSGSSWTTANHGLRELGFTAVAADPRTPGVLFTIANPLPGGFLGFSPQFLLRSADGGATWNSPFGDPNNSPFTNAIVADPSRPGTWYLATNAWVLKTRDGGQTWEKANLGLRLPEFVYTLTLAPSNPDALYAIGWSSFPLSNSPGIPVVIFRSVDGAAQWRRARVPGREPFDLLHTLAVDPVNPAIVYAAGHYLVKSTDGGVSWKRTASGLRGSVQGLAVDPFSPGTLYASIYVPQGRKVFKSSDGGATWKPASGGLPAGIVVGHLLPDPKIPGTLYAGTSRGVYVTRNGGGLWTAMNEGLGEAPIRSLALDPLRPGVLYAGRADGLFEYSSRLP